MTIRDPIAEFEQNLEAVLCWCRPRFSMLNLAEQLRSPELCPKKNIVCETFSREEIRDVIEDVISRREAMLQAKVERPGANTWFKDGSRLLAFFPERSLSHGSSVPETGGFIDECEIPAWDTWIIFVDDMLLSWVPFHLINAVDRAILSNPEGSIKWAPDANRPVIAELQSRHLLS